MRRLSSLLLMLFPTVAWSGVHVQQGDPLLTIGSLTVTTTATISGAVPILSTSSLQAGTTIYVASGTVAGNFSAGTIFASQIPNAQCLQSGPGGQITGTGSVCVSPGQNLLVTTNTWSGEQLFASPAQSSFTYGLTVGSLTVTNLGSSQCVQTGPGGILTGTGSSCAGASSGLLTATQTWSGQNNWTTPAQSSFTYGLTVGSMSVNGPGNGAIALTIAPTAGISASAFNVPSTSATPVVSQFAVWTSTNWTLGTAIAGGPGGPSNSIQYNNGTTFAGSNNFQINGTSTTFISSVTISNGTGGSNDGGIGGAGMLDIFMQSIQAPNQTILAAGSINLHDQVSCRDNIACLFQRGLQTTGLNIDSFGVNANQINSRSGANFISYWNNGEMDLQTTSSASGQDIVFLPKASEQLRLSGITGMTVSSTSTFKGTMGTVAQGAQSYMFEASTNAVPSSYSLAITTNGYLSVQTSSLTTVSCGLGSSVIGNNNYFKITPGSGSPGTCIVNFKPPFKLTPICFVTPETMSLVNSLSYSETSAAITLTQTSMTSVMDVHCVAQNE